MKLEKKNRGERLSTRELVLLVVLGVVLLAAAIGNFILLPEWDNYSQLKATIDVIESSTTVMEAEYANKGNIENSIIERSEEVLEKAKYLPTYLTQDEMIRVINTYLFDAEVTASNLSFTEMEEVPVIDYIGILPIFSDGELGMIQEFQGKVLLSSITLSVNGSYESIYRLLNLLETHSKELHVNSVNLSTAEEGMAGSISLSFIGYTDALVNGEYSPMMIIDGERNEIFTPYESYIFGGSGNYQKTLLPDFALSIRSARDNAPKIAMSEYGVSSSELFVDGNQTHSVDFSIWEDNGDVYYSYTMGGQTISNKHALANLDQNVVSLEVYSRNRDDITDNVSVLFNVDNRTNYSLEIKVLHDDNSQPRFILGSVTGEVLVK